MTAKASDGGGGRAWVEVKLQLRHDNAQEVLCVAVRVTDTRDIDDAEHGAVQSHQCAEGVEIAVRGTEGDMLKLEVDATQEGVGRRKRPSSSKGKLSCEALKKAGEKGC